MLPTSNSSVPTPYGAYLQRSPAELLGSLNDVEEKHAPKVLYLAGDVSLLDRGPRVSVVGSRKASADGLRRAGALAKALVDHGIIVVSGLALGIDVAAHTSAMTAGGRTIAVLGTPLDQYYPAENRELQIKMMIEQLVVSQFSSGYPVTPKNFPIRNRTMALLTDATVIVEAGEKSGTVHQGWEALRLGRLLFLLESVANDPTLSWPKQMIHYGAQVLSRTNLDDAFSDIPAVTQRFHGGLAEYL
jgi:DNA processing protein